MSNSSIVVIEGWLSRDTAEGSPIANALGFNKHADSPSSPIAESKSKNLKRKWYVLKGSKLYQYAKQPNAMKLAPEWTLDLGTSNLDIVPVAAPIISTSAHHNGFQSLRGNEHAEFVKTGFQISTKRPQESASSSRRGSIATKQLKTSSHRFFTDSEEQQAEWILTLRYVMFYVRRQQIFASSTVRYYCVDILIMLVVPGI